MSEQAFPTVSLGELAKRDANELALAVIRLTVTHENRVNARFTMYAKECYSGFCSNRMLFATEDDARELAKLLLAKWGFDEAFIANLGTGSIKVLKKAA